MDFEVQFSDLTLLESNGKYDSVCLIMNEHAKSTGALSKRNEWMLRSKITILSQFGFAYLICHFYWNGKVYIAEYMPSNKDIHNTDIRCLTCWCNEFGWKTPEPLPTTIQGWPDFWRKEWETYIVDSEYLEKKHGVRQEVQFEENKTNEDEETDTINEEEEK